mmetsp:Transcript_4217/g.3541  ORF Transcript_4217/g.3541 Transcript_4217/m.3541 type:complete len:85 (+) Transcript_4217:41-295(+)
MSLCKFLYSSYFSAILLSLFSTMGLTILLEFTINAIFLAFVQKNPPGSKIKIPNRDFVWNFNFGLNATFIKDEITIAYESIVYE